MKSKIILVFGFKSIRKSIFLLLFLVTGLNSINAQFVHPGVYHKKSDLDRMKYMVNEGIEPYKTSFENLRSLYSASYNYVIRKDPNDDTLARENPSHQRNQYEDDVIAAKHNALMWYITGDERHAKKAIAILNAWSSLKSFFGGGTEPLSAGLYATPLVDAAEIMKHTYDGWSATDIKKFGDMLVYPGYSSTVEPTAAIVASRADQEDGVTFYWSVYQGDPGRAGNQGLLAWRSVMAIGIFLDNEIMYERALRQVQGMSHRPDDFAYPSGPAILSGGNDRDFTDYARLVDGEYILRDDTHINIINEHYIDWKSGGRENTVEDWGYDDQIQHYIFPNGQVEESSRDQGHSSLGLGAIAEIAEIAWNQGDDIYSYLDDRLLTGLEYTAKYSVSFLQSYPDQPEPWEPTIENGEYIRFTNRTGRREGLKINPFITFNYDRFIRGENVTRPVYEMQTAHYNVREDKSDQAVWINRAKEKAVEINGTYEMGDGTDATGWGGLTFRRPEGCAGDPVMNVVENIPEFGVYKFPESVGGSIVIEAENYDYFSGNAEGRTYHETTETNTSGQYRIDNETTEKTVEDYVNEGVDIKQCSEGGYNVDEIASGEWISYTVYVPVSGLYDISIRYAAASENGQIKFNFNDKDVTEDVSVPFGGSNSTSLTDWKYFTAASGLVLEKGVQSMKVLFNGDSNAFELNNIKISLPSIACQDASEEPYFVKGINYKYYKGLWSEIPNFDLEDPVSEGLTDTIDFTEAIERDFFGLVFDGYIYAATDGDYTFYLESDEGSRLSINGVEVVDNDGVHTVQEKYGVICLKQGYQNIKLEYFDVTGTQKLSLMYEGPGIERTEIPNYFTLPPNLAINGIASQSSVSFDGHASLAIDGNTDGVFRNNSVTHTDPDTAGDNSKKWWQVELEKEYSILNIKIYNRTDTGSERLNNFTLELLDDEDNVMSTKFYEAYPNPFLDIDFVDPDTGKPIQAKKIMISKTSDEALSLAEVEVYGGDIVEVQEVNIEEGEENKVEMSPNPVSEENGYLLNISNSNEATISISNTVGKILFQVVSDKDQYSLDMSDLLSGIYFVTVSNGSSSTTKKIIRY